MRNLNIVPVGRHRPRRRTGSLVKSRSGFTLVELLVVIAIIGMLVAILLPAVNAAREAGRRTACANNLRNLALGCLNHEAAMKHLPTGGWNGQWVGDSNRGAGPKQPGGWVYNVLPYIEQENLYSLPPNELVDKTVPIFACPSRRDAISVEDGNTYYGGDGNPNSSTPFTPGWGTKIDFAACLGDWVDPNLDIVAPDDYGMEPGFGNAWPKTNILASANPQRRTGVIYQRSAIKNAHVTDGASQTLLAGEKFVALDLYDGGFDPGDNRNAYVGEDRNTLRTTRWSPLADLTSLEVTAGVAAGPDTDATGNTDWRFGSAHNVGLNLALCDGAVKFVAFAVDPVVFGLLGNRQDSESINVDEL